MQSQARTGVTQDLNVGLLGINFKALKNNALKVGFQLFNKGLKSEKHI